MSQMERTGWRDEGISRRHRRWGAACYAVDIDFLLIEYAGGGNPAALVEYKNEHAQQQYVSNPNYQALIKLGNAANIPVIACRYKDDFSEYKVTPLNPAARQYLPDRKTLSEREYVTLLYKLRGVDVPESVLDGINQEI